MRDWTLGNIGSDGPNLCSDGPNLCFGALNRKFFCSEKLVFVGVLQVFEKKWNKNGNNLEKTRAPP